MRVCQGAEIHCQGDSEPNFAGPELPANHAIDLEPALLEGNNASAVEERPPGKHRLNGDSKDKIILALYDEYRPRLYRYIRSKRLGREQADEIIQETFMRLTMELLKETKIENIQGWIVRVAHNLALNMLKKERVLAVDEEISAFLMQNRPDPALSPEEAYSMGQQVRLLKKVLSDLKPKHRQCFQMRAQGIPYKDIGLALGFSEQRAAFVVKQVAVHLAASCGLQNGGQGDR